MKKLAIIGLMVFGFSLTSTAQEISKNALGVRLGDNNGFGFEISYQRGLGDNNRLELDLGLRNNDENDAFKLVGLYQWVWQIENRFNWYVGVGGGVGSWDDNRNNNNNNDNYDDGVFFVAAGNIGIEYNFDIPLMISLDFRPELYFGNNYRNDNYGSDIGLSIRYQF